MQKIKSLQSIAMILVLLCIFRSKTRHFRIRYIEFVFILKKYFFEKNSLRLTKGNLPLRSPSPFASAYAAHPVKGHFVLRSEDFASPLTSFRCFGFRYLRRRLRGKFIPRPEGYILHAGSAWVACSRNSVR